MFDETIEILILRNSLIRIYTICNSKQSDQCLHCLPFSAVWSDLHYLPLSGVWSRSTLFAILSSLIRVYTICHSQQSDQGLHCISYSAVWSECTLFVILISLMRVYTVCHAQQSEQVVHYMLSSVSSGSTICTILSSLIRVNTNWNSF